MELAYSCRELRTLSLRGCEKLTDYCVGSVSLFCKKLKKLVLTECLSVLLLLLLCIVFIFVEITDMSLFMIAGWTSSLSSDLLRMLQKERDKEKSTKSSSSVRSIFSSHPCMNIYIFVICEQFFFLTEILLIFFFFFF
jgi:hypothetical protein